MYLTSKDPLPKEQGKKICFFFLSTDETEKLRKRKGQEANENPAKRKSCGPGDELDQHVNADATANALENLVLEKKLEEPLLGTSEGRQLAGQCSGTSIPEGSPEEDTDVQSQPEGKIKPQPGQYIAWLPVCMLRIYHYKFHSCQFVMLCLHMCQHFYFLFLWLLLYLANCL